MIIMPVNNNGETGFKLGQKRNVRDSMALYDDLPKEYRDVLKYTVSNLTIKNPKSANRVFKSSKKLKTWIKGVEVIATRETYGDDHPDYAY